MRRPHLTFLLPYKTPLAQHEGADAEVKCLNDDFRSVLNRSPSIKEEVPGVGSSRKEVDMRGIRDLPSISEVLPRVTFDYTFHAYRSHVDERFTVMIKQTLLIMSDTIIRDRSSATGLDPEHL